MINRSWVMKEKMLDRKVSQSLLRCDDTASGVRAGLLTTCQVLPPGPEQVSDTGQGSVGQRGQSMRPAERRALFLMGGWKVSPLLLLRRRYLEFNVECHHPYYTSNVGGLGHSNGLVGH